jgi:hypothetical protein
MPEEDDMSLKTACLMLTLFLVQVSLISPLQTSAQEREMDGVLTDTCCWCGPRPASCPKVDDQKENASRAQSSKNVHGGDCVNSCVNKYKAQYVVAPSTPCQKETVAMPGYILDDKYKDVAAQYAGKMVHIKGLFDDGNHEVQVASIGPADSPIPQSQNRDQVAWNENPIRVKGWVSDDKCGAKGANDKAEACTKKCLAAGAKMVIVTDKDQKILLVDNPDVLKGHEGHHIAVSGHVMGDSIHVESAKML